MIAPLSFALAGLLSAASDEIASPCGAAVPSSFDYVVLASMADSQHPLSMVSYRPSQRTASCAKLS
jgi:hypothetical protein